MKMPEEQAKKIILNLGRKHGIFIDALKFSSRWSLVGSTSRDNICHPFKLGNATKFICSSDVHSFIDVFSFETNVYKKILQKLMDMSRRTDIIFPNFCQNGETKDLVIVPKGISIYELLVQTDLVQTDLNSLEK